MPDKKAALKARAASIKEQLYPPRDDGNRYVENVQGSVQSSVALLSAIYGPNSRQVEHLLARARLGAAKEDVFGPAGYQGRLGRELVHILDSAVADLDSGVGQNIALEARGEVLGDFAGLAETALNANNSEADRVAAVLVAAGLEEALKVLGEARGVDVFNRDFRGVVQKLKDADVLRGPQAALARGFAEFRDKALHGQFELVERGTTISALMFLRSVLGTEFE